jgi:hypothetical protein
MVLIKKDDKLGLKAASVVSLGMAIAAVQLIPAVRLAAAHPRPAGLDDWLSPAEVIVALFSRTSQSVYQNYRWPMFETGAYLSPAFLIPIVAGFERGREWVAVAIILLLLALGNYGSFSLYALLHYLPLFSWERISARFLILFVLCLAVVAGYGTMRLGAYWAMFLLVLGMADSWPLDTRSLGPVLGQRQAISLAPARPFAQYRNPLQVEMFPSVNFGYGALNCWDPMIAASDKVVAMNDPKYRGEYYLDHHGKVKLTYWSPNLSVYSIEAVEPTTLVVNQRYATGWHSNVGKVVNHDGLIAVEVGPGKRRVELKY